MVGHTNHDLHQHEDHDERQSQHVQHGGWFLSQQERLLIADLRREGLSLRQVAARLGRAPSTISRELHRNTISTVGRYSPQAADRIARTRRRRPKTPKLVTDPSLWQYVQQKLERRWSPEEISHRMRLEHPDDRQMRVCHETIYQALYFQARGGLRREVASALRRGRAARRPRGEQRRGRQLGGEMIMISQRPAAVEDRAVPGHWEGDLIMGACNRSAIATLVERSTRFVMLGHLPDSHRAEEVAPVLVQQMKTLPQKLRGSLTWDQGVEMAEHQNIGIAAELPIYFCDPASPWQCGSNENTNGLLRQYFPKGTDLSVHSRQDLDEVAAELNDRPRETLGWWTPRESLNKLLEQHAS